MSPAIGLANGARAGAKHGAEIGLHEPVDRDGHTVSAFLAHERRVGGQRRLGDGYDRSEGDSEAHLAVSVAGMALNIIRP